MRSFEVENGKSYFGGNAKKHETQNGHACYTTPENTVFLKENTSLMSKCWTKLF